MNTGINLVTHHQPIVHKHLRKVIIVSVLIFIFVFLLTVTSILYTVFLNRQYDQLVIQEEEVTAQIETLGLKRQKVIMLTQRLSAIERLLSTRRTLDQRFATIADTLTNFSISDISVTDTKINLSLSSSNLAAYNTLFDNLSDMNTVATYSALSKEIVDVTIQDFGYANNSNLYESQLELEYKKKANTQ